MFLDTVQPLLVRDSKQASSWLEGAEQPCHLTSNMQRSRTTDSMEQQIILPVLMGAECSTVIDPRTAEGVHHGNCNGQSLGTRDRK